MKFYPHPASVVSAPPLRISVTGIATGLKVLFAAYPLNNVSGTDTADFRALFVAPGSVLPDIVDLRTPAEGGTLVHDGITAFVVNGILADFLGAQYTFLSANPGRWYFAWRFHNLDGFGLWSDGNTVPSEVFDRVDTIINAVTDIGAPAGWTAPIVSAGPSPNTVVVKVNRPPTNGKIIRGMMVQIKDGAVGAWRALDANAGQAVTHYDGSAVDMTLSANNKRLTRTAGAGFGAAVVGDLALIDVTGGAYAIANCQHRMITAYEGGNPATATWFEFDTELEPQVLVNLRFKIVTAPWTWTAADGYLGTQANHGWYSSYEPGARSIAGDLFSNQFVTPPIEIPAAVTTPEARVFFVNGYSTSDNAVTKSTGLGGNFDVNPPTTFTDFNDKDIWIPVNSRPDYVSMAIAPTGVTLTGLIASAASPITNGVFTGIISRSIFYPDLTTGILEIMVSFDSYVTPTDAAVGRRFLMGVSMLPAPAYLNATNQYIYGFGKCLATGPFTFSMNVIDQAALSAPSEIYNSGPYAIITPAAFSIDIKWGPRTSGAGTIKAVAFQQWSLNGNNGFPAPLTIADHGSDATNQFGAMHYNQGVRFAIGCWPMNGSNVGVARLTSFQLIQGREYRTGINSLISMIAAPQSSGGGSGNWPPWKIFSVTAS